MLFAKLSKSILSPISCSVLARLVLETLHKNVSCFREEPTFDLCIFTYARTGYLFGWLNIYNSILQPSARFLNTLDGTFQRYIYII